MRTSVKTWVIAAALATIAAGAHAEDKDKLKIGVIATLSGPPAVLGQQLRNGFELAVKELGGKMGGREVELFVQDDELKPDVAVSKVRALVDDTVEEPIRWQASNTAGEAVIREARLPRVIFTR